MTEPKGMTATQQAIAEIWCEVLERPAVGLDDDIFELGGDSLLVMIMLFRVKETLGVELSSAAVLEAPTLREFCETVEHARAGDVVLDAAQVG